MSLRYESNCFFSIVAHLRYCENAGFSSFSVLLTASRSVSATGFVFWSSSHLVRCDRVLPSFVKLFEISNTSDCLNGEETIFISRCFFGAFYDHHEDLLFFKKRLQFKI